MPRQQDQINAQLGSGSTLGLVLACLQFFVHNIDFTSKGVFVPKFWRHLQPREPLIGRGSILLVRQVGADFVDFMSAWGHILSSMDE